MRLVQPRPDALLSSSIVRMEDKKRPAMHDHDITGPPPKRQATVVNGTSKPHPDADMPWKEDIERYQKDAILRQMNEYKREAKNLEARLNEMTKRSTYHDEHLRMLDIWWEQLRNEIELQIGELGELGHDSRELDLLPTALLFADNDTFSEHLKTKEKGIRSLISTLVKRLPAAPTADISALQARITALLAAEKAHLVEIEQVNNERDQLQERLETASLRYMRAEKKYERARSTIVAKTEKQGSGVSQESSGGSGKSGQHSASKDPNDATNGATDSHEAIIEANLACKEATAVSEKQKEQLTKLAEENEQLELKLKTTSEKLTSLSDDDYAKTELFKTLKSQHEDVIKRINDLEARNIELRQEAEKLHAERTAFRVQVENEAQATVAESELRLRRTETDLARIRTSRDDYYAQVTVRQQADENDRNQLSQFQELANAREEKIKALDSEISRLRLQISQERPENLSSAAYDNLSKEDLITRILNLQGQYDMLSNEVPSIGAAWKKASALASKKVADTTAMEEKIARLQAEKSKADQKYFATMKAKDLQDQQLKSLQLQNQKSSEIVSQLKEVDAGTKQVVVNLEKQVAESRTALQNATNQSVQLNQQLAERTILVESLKSQIAEIKGTIHAKDLAMISTKKAHRELETEVEQLRVRATELEKMNRELRNRGSQSSQQETDMLRNLALCPVCRSRFKSTALRLCGHLFCRECIDDRQKVRLRNCPTCAKGFGLQDTMPVHL